MNAENALRRAVVGGALRNGPGDDSSDAALLQLALVRYPDRALWEITVTTIWNDLKLNDTPAGQAFLYRYRRRDDFGQPGSAFLICSFWLVQALAKTGRLAEATNVMNEALLAANPLGLLSEHYAPEHALQLGNFPQAYSHVGQINAAFAVSPPWSEVL